MKRNVAKKKKIKPVSSPAPSMERTDVQTQTSDTESGITSDTSPETVALQNTAPKVPFAESAAPPAAPALTSHISEEPGLAHRFIKNNAYFTICVYVFIMIIISAVVFKAIIDIEETKAGLTNIFSLLGPFLFGALVAYVLNPMVKAFSNGLENLCLWITKQCRRQNRFKKLKKFKIKPNYTVRTILSIALSYLLVIGFIVIMLNFILPEITRNITDFVNFVPQTYDTLLSYLDNLQKLFPSNDIESLSNPLTDALPDLVSAVRDMATNTVPALYSISMSIASGIINILITLIVSIYMIYDKNRLMKLGWRLLYAFLPQKSIPACHELFTECNRLFSSFVVGKFIDSTIIGILCFIVMSILRLKYVLLISLIVGVTNMIPYFGPFIGAIPGILILLFISPVQALIFAIMILCLQQFDGLILGPKILGDSTGLKPLWIIFAITIGGNIAGVVGMFLGVPVVAFFSFLIDRYLSYRLAKKGVSEKYIDSLVKTEKK